MGSILSTFQEDSKALESIIALYFSMESLRLPEAIWRHDHNILLIVLVPSSQTTHNK